MSTALCLHSMEGLERILKDGRSCHPWNEREKQINNLHLSTQDEGINIPQAETKRVEIMFALIVLLDTDSKRIPWLSVFGTSVRVSPLGLQKSEPNQTEPCFLRIWSHGVVLMCNTIHCCLEKTSLGCDGMVYGMVDGKHEDWRGFHTTSTSSMVSFVHKSP